MVQYVCGVVHSEHLKTHTFKMTFYLWNWVAILFLY